MDEAHSVYRTGREGTVIEDIEIGAVLAGWLRGVVGMILKQVAFGARTEGT